MIVFLGDGGAKIVYDFRFPVVRDRVGRGSSIRFLVVKDAVSSSFCALVKGARSFTS